MLQNWHSGYSASFRILLNAAYWYNVPVTVVCVKLSTVLHFGQKETTQK